MNEAPLVIYHRADSDGLLCQAIASRYFPTETVFVGWDYGDPVNPVWSTYGTIWMLDIAVKELLDDPKVRPALRVIDHHKTTLDTWGKYSGEFGLWRVSTEASACRLSWAHFTSAQTSVNWKDRQKGEPLLVYLVGLRDSWHHAGTPYEEHANFLELALRSQWPPDFRALVGEAIDVTWPNDPDFRVRTLIESGRTVDQYARSMASETAERGAMIVTFANLRFLCLNTLLRGSRALDEHSATRRDSHDAMMIWGVLSDGVVAVSMYHAPHRKDLDLSVIAKAQGGGGHPGACGFRTDLRFIESLLDPSEAPLSMVP